MTDLRRVAMQQALEALELSTPKPRSTEDDYAERGWREHDAAITALLDALAEPEPANYFNPDWDQVEALQESLREHMAEIQRLRAALAEPKPEPVAKAWAEGYQQGVEDERTSEANIGIAGCNAKVKPARQNPYKTNPPQRPPPTDWEAVAADQAMTIAMLRSERDALLDNIKGVIEAEQSEGRGRGGFANTPPTKEYQRRVVQAWQDLHKTIATSYDKRTDI